MKHPLLIAIFFLLGTQAYAQEIVYPLDSLSTKPAIPRNAVKIPKGRASGPSARLAFAVYDNIRFPRTALTNRVGGKIIVYGIVDTSGLFQIDSAVLFREQAVMVIGDEAAKVETQDVSLGVVKEFILKKKKWRVLDAPKKWSVAEKDIVSEAIRVTQNLPKFKPGTINGRKVLSYFEVPVVFRHGRDRF